MKCAKSHEHWHEQRVGTVGTESSTNCDKNGDENEPMARYNWQSAGTDD